MQHRVVFPLIVIGLSSAAVLGGEAGPARPVQPQNPAPFCMAQQACPPQPEGVLQIADYGNTATPIYGFAFGATNTVSTGGSGGGGGAGKVAFTDVTVTRMPDALSPQLLLDTALGRHLKWVDITLKRGTTADATYRLLDVIVTGFNATADSEQVSFTYTRIEFSAGGRLVCFDVLTNASCS